MRSPGLRPFCASVKKSHGASCAVLRANASRLGSSPAARSAQNTSAKRSGRWHSTSLPPSRRAPGPGVPENAPRKKGLARFWEMLSRDGFAFWRAGMLALLSALPFMLGVWFAVATHALLPLLLAGVVGGALMAPQLVGLNDTILRSLRDEPGYWWATYCRAWKRNAKASLLPGAVFGLLLGAQIFALFHTQWGQNLVLTVVMLVGVFFLSGLALLTFTQIALLDMSFGGVLRNALLLFLGYLPRAALAVLWLLLYVAAAALFFPLSVPGAVILSHSACRFGVFIVRHRPVG